MNDKKLNTKLKYAFKLNLLTVSGINDQKKAFANKGHR